MRVLLDGTLPRAFGTLLPGHRVQTVHQRRWSDLDDGPLLRAATSSLDHMPVWVPAVPFALIALTLFGFGLLAWFWSED